MTSVNIADMHKLVNETIYHLRNDKPLNLYKILGLTIDVCKHPNCNELIREAVTKILKYGDYLTNDDCETISMVYNILKNKKSNP